MTKKGLITIGGLMIATVIGGMMFLQSEKAASDVALPTAYNTGLWIWKAVDTTTKDEKQRLADDLYAAGIKNTYLDISAFADYFELPVNEKTAKLTKLKDSIREQTALFSQRGIATHALAGSVRWAEPGYHYIPMEIMKFVNDYNAEVPTDSKLVGLQFDIEPHGDAAFFKNPSLHLQDYLTLTKRLIERQATYNKSFLLGFTIPFWYDGTNPDVGPVKFENTSKYAAYHLIDQLATLNNGYVVVMDYRAKADGDNGSIAHARSEIAYANQGPVRVFVGQETAKVEPSSITFYDKGREALVNSLAALYKAFEDERSFGGFTINDHESFLRLWQAEKSGNQ